MCSEKVDEWQVMNVCGAEQNKLRMVKGKNTQLMVSKTQSGEWSVLGACGDRRDPLRHRAEPQFCCHLPRQVARRK